MSNFDEGVFPRLLPDFLLSKFQHLPFSSCFSHIFPYMSIYFHISIYIFPYNSIYFHIFPYFFHIYFHIFPAFGWLDSPAKIRLFGGNPNPGGPIFFSGGPARLRWLSTYAPPMRMKRSMVISCQWQLTSGHGSHTGIGHLSVISTKKTPFIECIIPFIAS